MTQSHEPAIELAAKLIELTVDPQQITVTNRIDELIEQTKANALS